MNYNETYKVYVNTNADGIITAINSSAFLPDVIITADKWTEIDEGTGDRYHHAQNHYLDKPLIDDNGIFNYLLIDGKPVLRSDEHKQPELDRLNALAEIAQLKQKLADTDYIGIKIGEGACAEDEYLEERAQRAAWRARINELEDKIS
ncbi:MAG: hypothetical protein IJZ95_07240 [Oscillospiraceae bacterium]|nr:hypothetical protein [Oscillospiraceae bacterium]